MPKTKKTAFDKYRDKKLKKDPEFAEEYLKEKEKINGKRKSVQVLPRKTRARS